MRISGWSSVLCSSDLAPSRFREVDIMLILGDQCVGGCDAGANPRDRQHLIDYASGDGEMRCLCLIALRFRLSADLLKFAARAAEQVEIVGNAAADSIRVEFRLTQIGRAAGRERECQVV